MISEITSEKILSINVELIYSLTFLLISNRSSIFMTSSSFRLGWAENISIVVVVGGFAECPLLKEELKKRYSKFVKIPNEADLAVLKGAVMYGHVSWKR
jgi:molecular chaperone DnaK (HSP70)